MRLALADLHRHLDGSLRPSTLRELAARHGRPVPGDLLFFPGMGLAEALDRFSFTLSLLQEPEVVCRVAAEICEDAAQEGVTTLEIRFAPQLHRGADPASIVDAALAGVAGRAGLVLCGLYGEPPAVLHGLVRLAADRPGVVGLDLAGGPAGGPGWSMCDYGPAFREAAAFGLGRTVHAGEGRPPAEMRTAVEELGAQRIGHGTTLLQEPSVRDLLVERQITVEACVTSNWHVGAIPAPDAHPLPAWLKAGVRAGVCTDNTLLSAVDAVEEHRRVAALPGMTPELLARAVSWGHAGAFRREAR